MSLLIKALESAERGKQAELKKGAAEATSFDDLGLEPLSTPKMADAAEKVISNSAAEAPANKTDSFNAAAAASMAQVKQQSEVKKDHKQQVAANVFVANQAAKKSTSPMALFMLGVAGALLVWFGLLGYQYLTKVSPSEADVVKPASQVVLATEAVSTTEQALPAAEPEAFAAVPLKDAETSATAAGSALKFDGNLSADISKQSATISKPDAAVSNQATQASVAESVSPANESAREFNKHTPLKLVSKTPSAAVDPTLLSAYEAYSRGDDAAAQKQYRQVLQGDTRNVDALLGMAAIALRQSRYADANGWYQKVLEIEPRNSTALSAVANLQLSGEPADAATADYASTESRIKSMLAQQPEAANLHAALGNLYAAQSQWSLAQAAYFNASRFAPNSADYAFNLAVSLDQLGKAGLALAQYQRALGLLNNSGASGLDKAQLEARIQALQQ